MRSNEPNAGADYVRALLPTGDPYFSPNLVCLDGSLRFRSPHSADLESRMEGLFSGAPSVATTLDFDTPGPRGLQGRLCASWGGLRRKITWFVPTFVTPFYGGIHTILRFADYFLKAHDVQSTFVVLPPAEERLIRDGMAAVVAQGTRGGQPDQAPSRSFDTSRSGTRGRGGGDPLDHRFPSAEIQSSSSEVLLRTGRRDALLSGRFHQRAGGSDVPDSASWAYATASE